MAEFGDEFQNLTADGVLSAEESMVMGNAMRLHGFADGQPAGYLYLQPGRYRLTTQGLRQSRHLRPNGIPYYELVIPERHTLWFSRGATLDLDPGVLLIIRAAVRAESTEIFGLPDVRSLRLRGDNFPWPDPPDPEPEQALVRIESTRMESIHPEWFGARSVDGYSGIAVNDAPAVTRGFQACIHAACRDRTRDGVSLPPLKVICRGIYCVNDTLVALPDENGRGALWLRGNGDASTRGLHIPALHRFARGYRPSRMPLNLSRSERADSALLRVHPAVSLEVSGVGFKCFGLENGVVSDRDVAHTVLIEDSAEAGSRTVGRHVYFDRCGLTGGRLAVVGIRPPAFTPFVVPGVFLPSRGRLDPFGIDPVPIVPTTVGTANGMKDVVLGFGPAPARPVVSRSPRYAFRDCAFDGIFVPQIIEGQGEQARVLARNRSSQFVIDALATPGSSLEMTGGKMVQSYDRPEDPLDLRAGIRVRGGSAFVRSVGFHLGEGPRPSRWTAEGEPDGQDLWLDTGDGAAPPHLTALHVDSQSWWFLGGQWVDATRPGAVCLLNVGAGDVNLEDWIRRRKVQSNLPNDAQQSRRLYTPPSIAWAGDGVPLLIEACMFRRYGTFAGPPTGGYTPSRVVSVGTSFFTPLSVTAATWLPGSVMPGPTDVSGALRGGAAAGHPLPARPGVQVNVVELPLRLRWM